MNPSLFDAALQVDMSSTMEMALVFVCTRCKSIDKQAGKLRVGVLHPSLVPLRRPRPPPPPLLSS